MPQFSDYVINDINVKIKAFIIIDLKKEMCKLKT